MKKNNKGIALAYTLMMMLVVFAICAVITGVMVGHIVASNVYSQNAETERLYMQIGQLFHDAKGDLSTFEEKLKAAEFEVETNAQSENEGTMPENEAVWRATSGGYTFVLNLGTATDSEGLPVYTLNILNPAGTKVLLTVGIDKDGTITEWTKGEIQETTDGQDG